MFFSRAKCKLMTMSMILAWIMVAPVLVVPTLILLISLPIWSNRNPRGIIHTRDQFNQVGIQSTSGSLYARHLTKCTAIFVAQHDNVVWLHFPSVIIWHLLREAFQIGKRHCSASVNMKKIKCIEKP